MGVVTNFGHLLPGGWDATAPSTPVLPAQGFVSAPSPQWAQRSLPSPLACTGEELRGTQETCGYCQAGDSSFLGHLWDMDVFCSGKELLCAARPG